MANTERWDERNILLRFAALSDLHIGESPAAKRRSPRWRRVF